MIMAGLRALLASLNPFRPKPPPHRDSSRKRIGLQQVIDQARPLFQHNPTLKRAELIKHIGRSYERLPISFDDLRKICLTPPKALPPATASREPHVAIPKRSSEKYSALGLGIYNETGKSSKRLQICFRQSLLAAVGLKIGDRISLKYHYESRSCEVTLCTQGGYVISRRTSGSGDGQCQISCSSLPWLQPTPTPLFAAETIVVQDRILFVVPASLVRTIN